MLGVDFKKHVDILRLVNLQGFDLTEEETESNCTPEQILNMLKIMLYQFGIYEERQIWINNDFVKTYKKIEKERQNTMNDEINKCKDISTSLNFDFENVKNNLKQS